MSGTTSSTRGRRSRNSQEFLSRAEGLILFDPAMGAIGRFVFGHFHHEPLGLKDEIQWNAPDGFSGEASKYYAAQGNASRVFGSANFKHELSLWHIAEIRYFSGLAYVASGGFRGPQLYPEVLWPCLKMIDSALSRFPSLASRMLVVLERQARATACKSILDICVKFSYQLRLN